MDQALVIKYAVAFPFERESRVDASGDVARLFRTGVASLAVARRESARAFLVLLGTMQYACCNYVSSLPWTYRWWWCRSPSRLRGGGGAGCGRT